MSRFVGQKSTKKRSKLEKLLRQDHSDVYFDNDRLNDQLSLQIDELTREKYRKDLERELEVGKLRKEIHELNLLKLGEEEEEPTHVKPGRPHTTGITTVNILRFLNSNPLYIGRLFHCYMLDESICLLGFMLSLLFYFYGKFY